MKDKEVKKDVIYCVYCGKESKLDAIECTKCKKELDPKNRPFRDYIKKKIEEKLDGEVQDTFISLIINFIRTNLYGTVLTCSIVISAISVVANVVNNSSDFEEVKERPVITQKLKYAGDGLTSKEVMINYLDALNDGNIRKAKAYELNSFHSDIFNSLVGKEIDTGYGSFLSQNELLDNKDMLFRDVKEYSEGNSFEVIPNGTYGDYEFVRHVIFMKYCYGNNCDDRKFTIAYDIEMIEIDGNYYVSGTIKETPLAVDDQVLYDFMVKFEGDTSKFTLQDIDNYITYEMY